MQLFYFRQRMAISSTSGDPHKHTRKKIKIILFYPEFQHFNPIFLSIQTTPYIHTHLHRFNPRSEMIKQAKIITTTNHHTQNKWASTRKCIMLEICYYLWLRHNLCRCKELHTNTLTHTTTTTINAERRENLFKQEKKIPFMSF